MRLLFKRLRALMPEKLPEIPVLPISSLSLITGAAAVTFGLGACLLAAGLSLAALDLMRGE